MGSRLNVSVARMTIWLLIQWWSNNSHWVQFCSRLQAAALWRRLIWLTGLLRWTTDTLNSCVHDPPVKLCSTDSPLSRPQLPFTCCPSHAALPSFTLCIIKIKWLQMRRCQSCLFTVHVSPGPETPCQTCQSGSRTRPFTSWRDITHNVSMARHKRRGNTLP